MQNIENIILGYWKLVSSKLFDKNKNLIKDPLDGSSGVITYSEAMQMSVQIMPKDYIHQQKDNYHAYFGDYSIDEEKQTVTHHVKGSTHPNMINQAFTRKVVFLDDNTMSLCTKPAENVFGDTRLLYHEAVWERFI